MSLLETGYVHRYKYVCIYLFIYIFYRSRYYAAKIYHLGLIDWLTLVHVFRFYKNVCQKTGSHRLRYNKVLVVSKVTRPLKQGIRQHNILNVPHYYLLFTLGLTLRC